MKIQFKLPATLLLFCATALLPQAWAQSQVINDTYSNGNPKASYTEDANALFQGPYVSYFRNGKVRSKGNLKDSKEQGTWEYSYNNGNPFSKLNFQDGLLQGKAHYHYRNGVLKEEFNTEVDLGQGPYKSYYRDGSKKSEGNLLDGNFEGPLTTYRKDGTVRKVVTCNCEKKRNKKQKKD